MSILSDFIKKRDAQNATQQETLKAEGTTVEQIEESSGTKSENEKAPETPRAVTQIAGSAGRNPSSIRKSATEAHEGHVSAGVEGTSPQQSGSNAAPTAQTSQNSPTITVRKIGVAGLKKPTVGVAQSAPRSAPSTVKNIAAPPTKPVAPVAPPTSPLGKLMQRAEGKAPPSYDTDPAYAEISPQASTILNEGETFSVQQMLKEWPDPEEDSEDDAEDRQAERTDLVKRAVARLDQIFATELETLKHAQAIHPICVELSNITKLTFLRVKQSPAAYDMLTKGDRSVIIRALRSMAEKRKAAVEGKKGAKADSAALEGISTFEDGAFDDAGDMDLGFGI